MSFDAIRGFVTLSKQISVKGSHPSVKELMTTLRRSGFTSSQISELSGDKWSATLVRQYTKNWGVVNEELSTQIKSMMPHLRKLVSSSMDINDVKHVLGLEKSVRAKGLSLEELTELNVVLRDIDLHPGEIGGGWSLYRGPYWSSILA